MATDKPNPTLSQLEQYHAKAAWNLKGPIRTSTFIAHQFPTFSSSAKESDDYWGSRITSKQINEFKKWIQLHTHA